MNSHNEQRQGRGLSACGVATMLLFASLAFAKSYDIIVDTDDLKVVPVTQPLPSVPADAEIKKRQEGWVHLQFDVSTDGQATNTSILDSLGGEVFETAALDAISAWSFDPVESVVADNRVTVKFKNGDRKEETSRSFMRWYNMAARELMSEDIVQAREYIERARAQSAWNLYEHSLLEVLDSEISAAANEPDMQLASLRRVIEIDNPNALSDRAQRKLLKSIFELELQKQQFASAQTTLAMLRDVKGSKKVVESLADEIAALDAALDDSVSSHHETAAEKGQPDAS